MADRQVEIPVYDHPLCKATMVCLRGPCQHYWSTITRFMAPGEEIRKKHSQSCLLDQTDLNEENLYYCSRWWPTFLSWVPETLRPLLRRRVVRLYELYLTTRGYDLSWKTWKDDIFEFDSDPEVIGDLNLGEKKRG